MNAAMNLLDRAAELNEDGVYELADGSFQNAVKYFEDAVKQMMQLCFHHHVHPSHAEAMSSCGAAASGSSSSSSSSSHSTNTTTNHGKHTSSSSSSLPLSPMAVLPPSRSSVEVPFLHDEDFYLYSCTITFHPSHDSTTPQDQPTPHEIAFYCATIWFNMALAHHQQAQKLLLRQLQPQQQQQQQREASLRQALLLYQEASRALETLQQLCSSSSYSSSVWLSSCRDDLILMQLAIWNNQGHILLELQQQQQPQPQQEVLRDAQRCFQLLLTHSMAVLRHADQSNFSVFEQSQIQEFIRNAMVFLDQTGRRRHNATANNGNGNGIVAAPCA